VFQHAGAELDGRTLHLPPGAALWALLDTPTD
jgi:hypothetical protein